MKNIPIVQADVAASFQKAVVDVLVEHAMHAVEEYGFKKFAIAGGVASNSALRSAMEEACKKRGVAFYHPSPILCTDNAAMIGAAAYYEYLAGTRSGWDLNAVPELKARRAVKKEKPYEKSVGIHPGSRPGKTHALSRAETVSAPSGKAVPLLFPEWLFRNVPLSMRLYW